jgi:hypothetical protein
MKAYEKYKSWWKEAQAPDLVPSAYWGEDADDAFKQHVKDLGLYDLMETLCRWEDE